MSIDADAFARLLLKTDALFEELIIHQREKVVTLAGTINPRLTREDLLNPHDYPELERNGRFQYEDGLLNGYIAAQMAWRASILSEGRDMLEASGWTPGGDANG